MNLHSFGTFSIQKSIPAELINFVEIFFLYQQVEINIPELNPEMVRG